MKSASTCRHLSRKLWRERRGAAAVEFAVVAPLLVLFMMTTIYFGIYLSAAHSVQQLAADGARASVAGLGDPERQTLTVSYITESAPEYFLVDGDRIEIGVESEAGDAVSVTVTYDAAPLLSWFPLSLEPYLDTTITRTAVVRVGGF